MKNRNTSWEDQDKLELLVSLGNAHVTKVKNGIAFSGKIPLSFDEQEELNEKYNKAFNERSKQHRIQSELDDKAEVISRASCARDIAKELIDAANRYCWECDRDTLAVDQVPDGIECEIEILLSVLSDLASYTAAKRSEDEVSEDVAYIAEFWKEDVSEYEEEDLEDAEAEAEA